VLDLQLKLSDKKLLISVQFTLEMCAAAKNAIKH